MDCGLQLNTFFFSVPPISLLSSLVWLLSSPFIYYFLPSFCLSFSIFRPHFPSFFSCLTSLFPFYLLLPPPLLFACHSPFSCSQWHPLPVPVPHPVHTPFPFPCIPLPSLLPFHIPYPFSLPYFLSCSLSLFPFLAFPNLPNFPFLFSVPFPFPCIPLPSLLPFPISHPIHWSRPLFPFLAFPYFPFFPFLFPIQSSPLFPFLAFPYFPFFPFLFPIQSCPLFPFLAFPYFPYFPFLFPIQSSSLFPFLAKKLHSLLFPTLLFYSPFHPDPFSLSLRSLTFPTSLFYSQPTWKSKNSTKVKKKTRTCSFLAVCLWKATDGWADSYYSRKLWQIWNDLSVSFCQDRVPALCSKGHSHADTPSCILGDNWKRSHFSSVMVTLKKCPQVCSLHEKSQYPIYCKLFCTAPPPPPPPPHPQKGGKKQPKKHHNKPPPFFFFLTICVFQSFANASSTEEVLLLSNLYVLIHFLSTWLCWGGGGGGGGAC